MADTTARIPVSKETRDEVLKPLKRGDDTYDDVIRREVGDGPITHRKTTAEIPTEDLADAIADRVSMANEPGVEIDTASIIDDLERLQELVDQVPERTADELEGRRR